ncbi:MAG: GTP-binding protein [Candidatus Giovannonibacteria bacterium]|nr:MAG: GTP-binding protein [Candidatus Giovannonibacteria bacterium]
MQNRPPIVVVMGHIDHGKTALLDYIRKTNVVAVESGGITQHIGAYEVEHAGKKLTFLDTPGHEAFSKMRSRGAVVADIAILVVAADDGVKPQTEEALATIKSAGIPFLAAINKIDKPAADPERVKNELAKEEVFLEGRGGNVPFVEISAKQGTGVDKLLETILLMAEMENLPADTKAFAGGVVIESHRDPKRGVTSTLLIRGGTLKKGEYVAAGGAVAKARILEDFKGDPIDFAGPSSPVLVVGFDKPPQVGAEFKAFFSQKEAIDAARTAGEKPAPGFFPPGGFIGLVIKADVSGSAEAIEHEAAKLKDIKILRSEAGEVSEDDIKLASTAANSLILAFKVGLSSTLRELALRLGVEVAQFEIIYELADFLKKKTEALLPKEEINKILGHARVLKIFKADGKTQIIGGKVQDGLIRRGAEFSVFRREKKIGEGKIENLQEGRVNASEVEAGKEFGALASSKISIAEGDILEILG